MIKKDIRLDETDITFVNEVREQQGLRSESEAVRYIIRQYRHRQKKEKDVQLAILRAIEEKTDILLDVANTDLMKRREEILYPVRMAESPVISKAKKLRKQELGHKKQRADYRKK